MIHSRKSMMSYMQNRGMIKGRGGGAYLFRAGDNLAR